LLEQNVIQRKRSEPQVSIVEATIPGVIGFIATLWPQVFFVGSSATATPQKLRWIRRAGVLLLLVAALYLTLSLVPK